MNRVLKWIAALLLAIGLGAGALYGNKFLARRALWPYSTGSREKAFLNSTWGMQPAEIERANSTKLQRSDEWAFLRILTYPTFLSKERYRSLAQSDMNIWGHEARVEYGFFDDKLFTYTVLLEAYDLSQLKKEIQSQMAEKYGTVIDTTEDAHLASGKWKQGDIRAAYWVTDNAGSKKLNCGILFDYMPMIRQIETASAQEKKRLF